MANRMGPDITVDGKLPLEQRIKQVQKITDSWDRM
jgi:hypothetical protein